LHAAADERGVRPLRSLLLGAAVLGSLSALAAESMVEITAAVGWTLQMLLSPVVQVRAGVVARRSGLHPAWTVLLASLAYWGPATAVGTVAWARTLRHMPLPQLGPSIVFPPWYGSYLAYAACSGVLVAVATLLVNRRRRGGQRRLSPRAAAEQ
jgi:hypothetical protein